MRDNDICELVNGIAKAIEKTPDGVYGYVGDNPKRDSEGRVLLVLNEDATRRVVLAKDAVMSGDGKCRAELSDAAKGVIASLFSAG